MLPGNNRFLGGVHAADRRAVTLPAAAVAGAHALDPGDLFRMGAVRWALHDSAERTGSAEHALELEAGYHVRVATVTVLPPDIPFYRLEPGASITAPTWSSTISSTWL